MCCINFIIHFMMTLHFLVAYLEYWNWVEWFTSLVKLGLVHMTLPLNYLFKPWEISLSKPCVSCKCEFVNTWNLANKILINYGVVDGTTTQENHQVWTIHIMHWILVSKWIYPKLRFQTRRHRFLPLTQTIHSDHTLS